jgi:hypothetical protein
LAFKIVEPRSKPAVVMHSRSAGSDETSTGLYIKEILTNREARMEMVISPSVVHSLMYEKSENRIGNLTKKNSYLFKKHGKKGESTPPPKISHVCLKAS